MLKRKIHRLSRYHLNTRTAVSALLVLGMMHLFTPKTASAFGLSQGLCKAAHYICERIAHGIGPVVGDRPWDEGCEDDNPPDENWCEFLIDQVEVIEDIIDLCGDDLQRICPY